MKLLVASISAFEVVQIALNTEMTMKTPMLARSGYTNSAVVDDTNEDPLLVVVAVPSSLSSHYP